MSAQGESGHYISFWLSFDDIWNKWDAPHYLSLAEVGYSPPAQNPLHIVFYPLYPWLVHATNFLLINDIFTSAIIASLACYLIASWVLFKLVDKEFGDSTIALGSVKYLAIFPFSMFYGTAYTESLFLLTTVSCFWFLRSEKWLWAGVFGGLAAITRNQGILLLVPILIEAYLQRNSVPLKNRIFAILATASGFAGYLFLNWTIFGNPFQFKIAQQQNWSQSFGFFADNIANIFQGVLTDTHSMVFGIWFPTIICFFAACYLLWWGRHRLPASYQAYSLVYLLISFSPTWLLSGPRYMSVLFPLAILTALWAGQGQVRKQCVDTILFSSLILATYLFTRGWVY
ncbi:glycosyltransferase family 39 protein [Chitinibacter bivalviorum]|uniref:Glycosyltransferase family 39 protein n=1 Tax=Chitinibacter bivalviorum TaxID=2739434 RepID=A0A7H9BM46_9NEIS|nr:glycosyltransferase family 39 protein [Chitinibacter bivalviorum]QLG89693.1 glycosyltransferase family 39 protein [Chitinibacter bivalviorum]